MRAFLQKRSTKSINQNGDVARLVASYKVQAAMIITAALLLPIANYVGFYTYFFLNILPFAFVMASILVIGINKLFAHSFSLLDGFTRRVLYAILGVQTIILFLLPYVYIIPLSTGILLIWVPYLLIPVMLTIIYWVCVLRDRRVSTESEGFPLVAFLVNMLFPAICLLIGLVPYLGGVIWLAPMFLLSVTLACAESTYVCSRQLSRQPAA